MCVESPNTNSIIIVQGESGTGKTIILQEIKNHAATMLRGSPDSVERTHSFGCLRSIVRALLLAKIEQTAANFTPDLFSGTKSISKGTIDSIPEDVDTSVVVKVRKSSISGFRKNSYRPRRTSNWSVSLDVPIEESDELVSSQKRKSNIDNLHVTMPNDERLGRDSSMLKHLVDSNLIKSAFIPLINMILPIDLPETQSTLNLSPAKREAELEKIILEMLIEFSQQSGMVLVFDDAQFLDPETCKLILELVKLKNVKISVIFGYRLGKNCECPIFQQIRSLEGSVSFDLQNFSIRSIYLFLNSHYSICKVDHEFVEFLNDKTSGNPGNLTKMMDYLLSSKVIEINKDSGEMAMNVALQEINFEVPEAVRAEKMLVLDGLDGCSQNLLRICSACDELISMEMLNHVYKRFFTNASVDRMQSIRCDRTMSAKGIIQKPEFFNITHQQNCLLSMAQDRLVVFNVNSQHVKIVDKEMQSVIYGTMLCCQREALHRHIVQWYSAQCSDEVKMSFSYLKTIGTHRVASEQFLPALHDFQRASELALSKGKFVDAQNCMDGMNNILHELHQRSDITTDMLEVLLSALEFYYAQLHIHNHKWPRAMECLKFVLKTFDPNHKQTKAMLAAASTDLQRIASQVCLKTCKAMRKELEAAEQQRKKHEDCLLKLSKLAICRRE